MDIRTAVILHNTAPECVDATRQTMKMLGSDLIEENGRFFIPGSPSDYPVWAALHQGYVKSLDVTFETAISGVTE